MTKLDELDRGILRELQLSGRISIADLAERVGLSASPCWRRVRRLEETGVISRYAALIEPAALGVELNAFVYLSLDLHQAEAFEAAIMACDQVVQCYALTGEQDYLLHVMAANIQAFDHFLRSDLIHMPGVERVRTSFALKTVKPDALVPLGQGGA